MRVTGITGNPCSRLPLPVALVVETLDIAVVHQPVHRCQGHGGAGQDLVPLPERLVGGHRQGAALVPVAEKLNL